MKFDPGKGQKIDRWSLVEVGLLLDVVWISSGECLLVWIRTSVDEFRIKMFIAEEETRRGTMDGIVGDVAVRFIRLVQLD